MQGEAMNAYEGNQEAERYMVICNKCGSFYQAKKESLEYCLTEGGCFLCPSLDMRYERKKEPKGRKARCK